MPLLGCTTADLPGDRAADVITAPLLLEAPHPLPAVALTTLSGKPIRLEEAAAGRPALVTYWASWCEACLSELPALNRLHDRAGEGVVIAVAVGETREATATFARQHGLRYQQLADETMALAEALGQKRLPATMVLDRRGQVIFTGAALDPSALAAFRAALREAK